MSGPAGGVTAAPRTGRRLAARAWAEPVVITGFAGAVDGPLELPSETAEAVVRGPFAGVKLPGNPHVPAAQALVAALGEALAHPATGEPPTEEDRAIVVGTRAAALSEVIQFMEAVDATGPTLVNPGLFPFTVMNAAAGLAAIEHGCRGANVTLNNGSTSALDAVIYAADLVASGRSKLVFAGGFEGLGDKTSQALARGEAPVQVAVLVAVTDLRTAQAAGATPSARLLAWCSSESGDRPGEAARRDARRAAWLAAEPLLPPASRQPAERPTETRPERALLALLAAAGRLRSAPAAIADVLSAGAQTGSAVTALVLGGPGTP